MEKKKKGTCINNIVKNCQLPVIKKASISSQHSILEKIFILHLRVSHDFKSSLAVCYISNTVAIVFTTKNKIFCVVSGIPV